LGIGTLSRAADTFWGIQEIQTHVQPRLFRVLGATDCNWLIDTAIRPGYAWSLLDITDLNRTYKVELHLANSVNWVA
jgi:hypothetical protein